MSSESDSLSSLESDTPADWENNAATVPLTEAAPASEAAPGANAAAEAERVPSANMTPVLEQNFAEYTI